MKKKVIAIVFSDLHINNWSKFNNSGKRTDDHFKLLSIINELCTKYRCKALFCGDLFHKPENIDQELLNKSIKEFRTLFNRGLEIVAISGNHDIRLRSIAKEAPVSWVSIFSNINSNMHCLDYKWLGLTEDITVHGVPYIDHNVGLSDVLKSIDTKDGRKHILLLHTDYPGAKDTDGREVDSVENLNLNSINKFDLVLCGHIHKPQRLSKKVYMIGAPFQQRRTDSNCKLGYWLLYNDLSMEFNELSDFPKFIDVESEDEIKDDGNYYTVLPAKSRELEVKEHGINQQLNKKSLARKYMREKGIHDKDKKHLLINILNQAETC